MTTEDPPSLTLGAVTALATGRPALHVPAADEPVVNAITATLHALFGPLPQLDVIEPAEDEPFEVRVELPGLTPDRWLAASRALPDAILTPAPYPGQREAMDCGLFVPELITGDGVTAQALIDAEAGGLLRPERVRTRVPDDEPDLAALAAEIVDAVRAVDPAITLRSDRGTDAIQPFVHPHTGRYGVEVHLDGVEGAAMAGDEVQRRRVAVLQAIGGVIAARANHERLALAPDVWWEPVLGLRFLLWVVGPPAAARPGDADLAEPWPAVDGFLPAWSTLFDRIEIAVVTAPVDHDEAVLAVANLAETLTVPLSGGRPRWVKLDGEPCFAACWDAPLVAGIDDAVEAIRALPGVRAVRAAPAGPYGFQEWATADAAWWPMSDGFALRLHDARTDRDTLPMVAPREPTSRDATAMDALIAACAHLPEEASGLRAVEDGSARAGLELSLPREVVQPEVLRRWLDALGNAPASEPTHVWFVGWRGDQALAYRFWPHTPDNPPPWGPSANQR